jgi:hypothetical protein
LRNIGVGVEAASLRRATAGGAAFAGLVAGLVAGFAAVFEADFAVFAIFVAGLALAFAAFTELGPAARAGRSLLARRSAVALCFFLAMPLVISQRGTGRDLCERDAGSRARRRVKPRRAEARRVVP